MNEIALDNQKVISDGIKKQEYELEETASKSKNASPLEMKKATPVPTPTPEPIIIPKTKEEMKSLQKLGFTYDEAQTLDPEVIPFQEQYEKINGMEQVLAMHQDIFGELIEAWKIQFVGEKEIVDYTTQPKHYEEWSWRKRLTFDKEKYENVLSWFEKDETRRSLK